MPLFFQQQVNAHTQLAVWKIEETEAFFAASVPLQRSITHPHKRLQHLAGRYLLKFLYPDFPLELILIADTRKPYLENERFHFSISHCGDFAAVIVSTKNRVGIDIELVTGKIARIRHKFVSETEWQVVNNQWALFNKPWPVTAPNAGASENGFIQNQQLTLIWSCKEAVFKWYGSGNVDFKGHMQLQHLQTLDNKLFQTAILFTKEDRLLGLQSLLFNELCLSFLAT